MADPMVAERANRRRGRSTGSKSRGWCRPAGRSTSSKSRPRSRKEGALPIFGARPRHGAGHPWPAPAGWRRGLRLLPVAADAARARRPLADALGSGMGRAGGYSTARYRRGVQLPNPGGAHALPMCGGVGAQYAPAAGWAQAIAYKRAVLGETDERRDRGGAGRRRELRDGRILVGANNCDDATCRCYFTSRTMATASRCRPITRRRGATSPPTSPASPGSRSGTATGPSRRSGAADRRSGRACP